MAAPHWEFCCGKLIVQVIRRNCFFLQVLHLKVKFTQCQKVESKKLLATFLFAAQFRFYVIFFWWLSLFLAIADFNLS